MVDEGSNRVLAANRRDAGASERSAKKIKCVVWDLDNTLWDGILLEGDTLRPKAEVVRIIRALDERGILHSIASRNDFDAAMERLEAFGLAEYFLYPQIGWGAKSASIQRIVDEINIGIDTIAFVDDQAFEREEVAFVHPKVRCFDALDLDGFLDREALVPRFIADDSKLRRQRYRKDAERKQAQASFEGSEEEFLASLRMRFAIAPAQQADLARVEELTVRTNQLNSTGYTFSYEELDVLRTSPGHRVLVASLDDRFGSYGKIGLALVETTASCWTLKLLLMSCRVMARGVGTLMLHHIMRSAKAAGARLVAEFVPTPRNRMMYVTYKFGGFREVGTREGVSLLEHDLRRIPDPPAYVQLDITA